MPGTATDPISGLDVRKRGALRPEHVPGIEVVKMLSADHDPVVLKLEDNAAEDVELLARALGTVVMNADDAAILTLEDV